MYLQFDSHLNNQVITTVTNQYPNNEAQKKVWESIHRELNQTWNSSPTRVEIPMSDGTAKECNTKEEVKQGIGEEISGRFSQADIALICQRALFDLLGYSADMEAAFTILEGTFMPPPGITPTTMIILEEIETIWAKMGEGEVEIVVSIEDFQYYWKRAKAKNSVAILWAEFRTLQSHRTL